MNSIHEFEGEMRGRRRKSESSRGSRGVRERRRERETREVTPSTRGNICTRGRDIHSRQSSIIGRSEEEMNKRCSLWISG